MRRTCLCQVVGAFGLSLLLALQAAADPSDTFQSAPVSAAPKPAPRPRLPAARETAPVEPAYVPPVPAPPPRPSLLGTWRGQAWQWPVVMVVQADDGQSISLELIGSQIVAGQAIPTAPAAYRVSRQADGSFRVDDPRSGNAVENAHLCGTDICATYFRRESDARTPVVFRRSQ